MNKGNKPAYYGLISTNNPNGTFNRIGKIAVWKQTPMPNSKQPPFSGNIEINGQRYQVALWQQLEES